MSHEIPWWVIVGPTASGKTALALALAAKIKGGIINADSVQVYRGLDIGSAKPTPHERSQCPHALFDTRSPEEPWTAADFVREAEAIGAEWARSGIQPIIVGGTGLYIHAFINGLAPIPPTDPELRARLQERADTAEPGELHRELASLDPERASQVHPNDTLRIVRALEIFQLSGDKPSARFEDQESVRRRARVLVLGGSREALYAKINRRTAQMIDAGLLNEVRGLLASGVSPDAHALKSIGYREAVEVALGSADEEDLIDRIAQRTRRFARKQQNWWRRLEGATWLDHEEVAADPEGALDELLSSSQAS